LGKVQNIPIILVEQVAQLSQIIEIIVLSLPWRQVSEGFEEAR